MEEYNELVIETAPYEAALPRSITAVFVLPDSHRGQLEQARGVVDGLRAEYGEEAEGIPLVVYDHRALPRTGPVTDPNKRAFYLLGSEPAADQMDRPAPDNLHHHHDPHVHG